MQDTQTAGRRFSRPLALSLVLVLAGLAATTIDLPVSGWFLAGHCPSLVVKLCVLAEVFAYAPGVAAIVLTVYVLDPIARKQVPRIAAALIGAGLIADVLKMVIARDRPRHFSFHGGAADTFGRWFPLLSAGSGGQSFPSAHAAVAACLAVMLGWLYPRGRWLFAGFAILAGGQRLVTGAHFPSDVLWGVAIGCFVASGCLPGGMLVRGAARLIRRGRGPNAGAEIAVGPGDSLAA